VLVSAEAVRLLHWKAGWVTEPAPPLFEIVLGEWHAYDGHVGYPGRSPAAMHVAEFDQRVRERRHRFLRTTAQAGISGAQRRYAITFVVVAFSVIVQGGTVSWLTRRLRIPQRATEPELWSPGIRFRHEPEGLYRRREHPPSGLSGSPPARRGPHDSKRRHGHTASRSRVSGPPRAAGMRHPHEVAPLRVVATGPSRETSFPG
jgi:hypothetical protein